MTLAWGLFFLVVVALLALDLGVFHRHAHAISLREATGWSVFWVGLGLAFSGLVWIAFAHPHGWGLAGPLAGRPYDAFMAYLSAFLLEKMLSVDNLFVIAVLMRTFRVPAHDQHRVLFWGILGAIVLRGIMIGGGVWLVHAFEWLFYLFGAWLLWTGVGLLRAHHDDEPDVGVAVRFVRRYLPVADDDESGRFVVRRAGRLRFTRLALALIAIELTDVMFALDSVPAVLGVTNPPDRFIVYSSNIFAILGLRALFFVLSASLVRFRYLGQAVATVLIFVGARMILHEVVDLPVWTSLITIVACLGVGIGASLLAERRTL